MKIQNKQLQKQVIRSQCRRAWYVFIASFISLLYFWAYPLYPKDRESRNIRYGVSTTNLLLIMVSSAIAFKKPDIEIEAQEQA